MTLDDRQRVVSGAVRRVDTLVGFPPSGRTLRMSGATVYDFEGDRITGHWQIIDRLGVFLQLRQTASAEWTVAG
jgi:predicted ester cyclase